MTSRRVPQHDATTLGFIRGERPLKDLKDAGIWLEPLATGGIEVKTRSNVSVPVSLLDFSRGLLANLQLPETLRTWGLVVYAAGVLADDFQLDRRGEILLDALWDAAFGEEIKRAAVVTA